ncbi:MAG: sigma-E processing peptidase SpoIIGA [Clostridia bacterium]|nr:sigma-E processing peptidase SpoIIGA [Clostridia bacterium]
MEQVVYGDVLFFVNFCMDFQSLFLTAKLMRRPFYLLRSVLAAALGALYACAALFLGTVGVWAFLADCGVCLGMCLISFAGEGSGLRRVLLSFAVYFGVSFAVGGVMSGMATLLSHVSVPTGGKSDLTSSAFFLLAALGGALTFWWGRFCQRRAKGKRAELTVRYGGKCLTLRCMVDTANLLRDPVSGLPVVLVDQKSLHGFLPASLLSVVNKNPMALGDLPHDLARRVRLIPAKTATGDGLLHALAPDGALLDVGRGAVSTELLIAPMALGVDTDDYVALLPAELITDA